MLASKKTDLPYMAKPGLFIIETDMEPSGGVDKIDGKEGGAFRFSRKGLDGDADLLAQFFLQPVGAAPHLVTPVSQAGADNGNVPAVDANAVHTEIPLHGRIFAPARKPAVFTTVVCEEGCKLIVVEGTADDEFIVLQNLPVFDTGRHPEEIGSAADGHDLFLGKLRHGDVIAKMLPQFQLPPFLAEEVLKHLPVNGIAHLLASRPRLKALTDDGVDAGDGFFLPRYIDPPQAGQNRILLALLEKDPGRPFPLGAEGLDRKSVV